MFKGQNRASSGNIYSNKHKSAGVEAQKGILTNEEISRKRKSLNFTASRYDSDEDLGLPLAESTVLKKQRINQNTVENIRETQNRQNNLISSPNISIPMEENDNGINSENSKFVEFLSESGIKINSNPPCVACKY